MLDYWNFTLEPENATQIIFHRYGNRLNKCVVNTLLWIAYQRYGTLIPTWKCNRMPNKVWDGLTYPFPMFNGVVVEVCARISNFTPHYTWFLIHVSIKVNSNVGTSSILLFQEDVTARWLMPIIFLVLLYIWLCLFKSISIKFAFLVLGLPRDCSEITLLNRGNTSSTSTMDG